MDMGDRTNLTMEVSGFWMDAQHVDELRDKLAKKLERVLPGYGLEEFNYDGLNGIEGQRGVPGLTLKGIGGQPGYTSFSLGWHEMSLGTLTEFTPRHIAKIAKWLDGHAGPWTEFRIWEDPAYEWLGQVVVRMRNGRQFDGTCDANGRLQISEDQIEFERDLTDEQLGAHIRSLLPLPPARVSAGKVYFGERFRSVRQVESFVLMAETPEEALHLDDLVARADGDDEDAVAELNRLIDDTEFEVVGTTDADEENIRIIINDTKERARDR